MQNLQEGFSNKPLFVYRSTINFDEQRIESCCKTHSINQIVNRRVECQFQATSIYYNQKQLPEVFYEKGVIRNFAKFTGKQHLCQSLFFKKVTLVQVFSCEFFEISKNTSFTEHLWTTASVQLLFKGATENFFSKVF